MRWFDSASPEQRHNGVEWYPQAIDTVNSYAGINSVWTRETSAAVCAVLSPRITWAENTKALSRFHKCAQEGLQFIPSVAGLRANVERGWYIAHSGDVSVVSGPKVSSFYANLLGDFSRVTVDSWMARAAGLPESSMNLLKGRRYAHLQESYQKCALRTGYTPAQFQAIVWVTIRGKPNE